MIDLSKKENIFTKFKNKLSDWYERNTGLISFVILLIITGFLFYGYIMMNNRFATPFSGDYVMQYIPLAFNYYDDWHYFFQTGVFPYWDSNVFLGADMITSNGYYIMFSPFFAILLIFPRSWIPSMLGIVSVLRIVLAGVFFRLYLKKLNVKETFAQIGAIAFACCGWMAFYQWFNNFLDILVFFPCILLGIEYVIQNKRPWILIMSLGLLGIDNFFFFPATCIMMAIYALFRYFQRIKLNNLKDNLIIVGLGIGSFALAVMFSMVVFLPGLITGLSDPKVSELSYLGKLIEALKESDFGTFFSLLVFWEGTSSAGKSFFVFYPVIEMFFPATTCRNLGLIYRPYDTNYAGSLWVATPIMFFFFPALVQNLKDKKWSTLVGVGLMIFALFTPALYYLLFGGAQCYSRWTLIYCSSIIAFVCIYLSNYSDKITIKTLLLGYIYFVFGVCLSAIFCNELVTKEGLEYFVPFPLVVIIELVYLTILLVVYALLFKKANIFKFMVYVAMFESLLMGTFVAIGHTWSNLNTVNSGLNKNFEVNDIVSDIKSQDPSFYRTYTKYNGTDWNNPNQNNYNGVSFFHTLYNYNTQRFKYWMSITQSSGSWSGYYPLKLQNLDTFLNIKYYLIDNSDIRLPIESGYRPNVPLDYVLNEDLSNDNFKVYVNDKGYLNIGYSYDTISTYPLDSSITSGMGMYSRYNVIANSESILNRAFMIEEDYLSLNEEIKADLTYEEEYLDNAHMSFKSLTGNNKYILKKYEYPSSDIDEWNRLWWDERGYGALNDLYKVIDNRERLNYTNEDGAHYVGVLTKRYNGESYTAQQYFSDPANAFDYYDDGISIIVNSIYDYSNRIDVFLLGKDGKVLTFDNHGDNLVNSATFLKYRQFYANEEVYAIVYRIRNGGKGGQLTTYAESYKTYQERINKLNEYPLSDVKYVNANEFTFKTNYPSYRYVVTNIAYEKGWKVFATNSSGESKQLDTYLSSGGFVGFVAEKGLTNYTLTYRNELAAFGEKFTIATFMTVLVSYAAMIYIENERFYRSYKSLFSRED